MFDQFNRLGEFVVSKIEQDYLVSIERQRRRIHRKNPYHGIYIECPCTLHSTSI